MKRNKSIVVLLLLVVMLQIALSVSLGKKELNNFHDDSKYQSGQVEQNVQITINFVDYMTIVATNYFSGENDGEYDLYNELVYDSQYNIYYINDEYADSDDIGSLVGQGEVPVSEEVITELDLAYTFNDYFAKFYENNENIAWVYYISESGFVSAYPYVPPTQMGNPIEFQSCPFYIDVLPENNPEREAKWSDVYTDTWGKGQVITLSIPIYDGDEFKGVLSVDRTIVDIEEILRADYDTYLLDDDSSVIASNTSISGSSENPSCVTNDELVNIYNNSDVASDEIELINHHFVYTNPIEGSDWVYIALIPASEIVLSSIVKSSPLIITTIIMIFIYFYFQRRKDQKKLLEHAKFLEETVSERTKEIRLTQEITIEAVSSLTESRDTETGNHILRTKIYTRVLANELFNLGRYREYLTDEKIQDISMSAPLHDIGKVGIRDSILLKPGKLTGAEFSEMKLHTKMGADVLTKAAAKLGASSFLDCAIEMARSHHERWDGTGYPYGLSGEQIPIAARIMAVADVYDALRSERVYKSAMSHEEAYKIIVSESGKAFDPYVVDAFVESNHNFKEVSEKYTD